MNMHMMKKTLLWVLCLCMAASSACAMGLNVSQSDTWKMRVSWSSRLEVESVEVFTGSDGVRLRTMPASGATTVTFDKIPPQGTYRIKALDRAGNVVAEAGEVSGEVDKWSKYGANITICEIVRRTNNDISKSVWDVKHPTVKNITAEELGEFMNEGINFYLHWKVQFKQKSTAQRFRTDVVMHTPSGEIYTDNWDTSFDTDLKAGGFWNCYPSLSGSNNDVMTKYMKNHTTWEKGTYVFRLYADGQFLKEAKLTVK